MTERCGAYKEHWKELGKPEGWEGCSLPKWHKGNHTDMGDVEVNQFNQPLIPCRLCGRSTSMLGTKLCDPCWELETRIHHSPNLARRILKEMKVKS